MVKNTHGGNKSKGLARKQMHSTSSLYLPSSPLEVFAVVTKMLGNGMFYANIADGTQMLGHIRNKFRGRSKHNHMVAVGNVVLIGLREWESPNYKNADIIAVYESSDVPILSQTYTIPCIEQTYSTSSHFDFVNETAPVDTSFNETMFMDL
jgi:initiation factor 1A